MIPPLKEYPFALRPMIAAHRGDTSLDAPENSIEAIGAALISGADMIEVDVQWSRDEVFVCYHDEHIELKAGKSMAVHDNDWQELDAAIRADGGKHGLTTLAEVLDKTQGQVYLNIEVKEYTDRDPNKFMQSLERQLEEARMDRYVLFSSFRMDFLVAASWTIPSVIIQPSNRMQEFFNAHSSRPIALKKSVEEMLPSELIEVAHATAYACELEELNDVRMTNIKERNLFLSIYTIRTEEDFDRAIGRGAMALVCEDPKTFAALRNKRFKNSVSTKI